MRRTLLVLLSVLMLPVVHAPWGAADEGGGPCAHASPLDPEHRSARIAPADPGTRETYCLFSGPYTIPPGHDLSRVDFEVSLAPGFIVGGGPGIADVFGEEPDHQTMHIHHAHWWFMDGGADNHGPQLPGVTWISGAGEEETQADLSLIADAEPDGPRYGIHVRQGERTMLINMLHNKTSEPMVVWVRVTLDFVHGTPEQLLDVTGKEHRDLTPVLFGSTFDVERGSGGPDGRYTFPHDLESGGGGDFLYDATIEPGVGQVWTAPFSGTIVIGAGHLHPGGLRVIVTNWGRTDDPCPSDRGDGIPGTTLYELDLLDRVATPSEEFQIEITQPGFRAHVREGDRIVLNGVYESAEHSWYEAMSHTGFYVDRREVPDSSACVVERIGTPDGWSPPLGVDPESLAVTDGVPNRDWFGEPEAVCAGDACHANRPAPAHGPAIDTVTIAGFQYLPGGAGLPAPVVERGTPLTFVNADLAAYIRHTVTSCPAPCDGPYVANYPLPDGTYDSGYMGYEPSSGGSYSPLWTLDTSDLDPGLHAYYCRVHPWMRGSFYLT